MQQAGSAAWGGRLRWPGRHRAGLAMLAHQGLIDHHAMLRGGAFAQQRPGARGASMPSPGKRLELGSLVLQLGQVLYRLVRELAIPFVVGRLADAAFSTCLVDLGAEFVLLDEARKSGLH